MPRTNSSTKTHVRALKAAMASEGFTASYTQARRIWDSTAAAATDESSLAAQLRTGIPLGAAMLEAGMKVPRSLLLSDEHPFSPSPAPELPTDLTPGAALLEAVRVVLSDQGAHVASAVDPGLPPLGGHHDGPELLSALGWEPRGDGSYTRCGPRIGTMAWNEDEGDWLIMLHSVTAFEESAKRIPQLVSAAQTPAAAWQLVWEEHLTAPGRHQRTRGGALVSTIRVRMGDRYVTGVPVLLSTLLNPGNAVASDDVVPTAAASTTPWTTVDAEIFVWDPIQHGSLLVSGGSDTDRNLVQSRLSLALSSSGDYEVARMTGLGGPSDGLGRALRRHHEAVASGAVPSRPLVVDVVKPLSDLPLSYDGATALHQLKHLASAGASSNTFILARDHERSDALENVEHALLSPFGHGEAEEMGLYEVPGFKAMTPGVAVVSFRP